MDRKKNLVIASMIAAVLVMVVVFAALQTNLVIDGMGSVTSSWKIEITKITSKAEGEAHLLETPVYNATSATLVTGLRKPGDKMTYTITVANNGSIDAIIDDVKAKEAGSEVVIYSLEGLQSQVRLKAGASTTFKVIVEFDINATYIPTGTTKELTIDINCVQDDNQTLTPIDPSIETNIAMLSGNGSVTLEDSAGTNLVNYVIKGNSVQVATPTPTAPVEIQSVGIKTKNLFDYTKVENKKQYIDRTNGEVVATTDNYRVSDFIEIEGGKTYYCNATPFTSSIAGIALYDSNKQFISGASATSWKNVSMRYNTSTAAKYLRITINADTTDLSTVQVEEGQGGTLFEPYGKYKIPIKVTGSNLFSSGSTNTMSYTQGYSITRTYNSSEFVINGTGTSALSTTVVDTRDVFEAGTYTFTVKGLNEGDYIFIKDENGNNIEDTSSKIWKFTNNFIASFTLEKAQRLSICIHLTSGSSYSNKTIQLQLEKSLTLSNYEDVGDIVNIYIDEPLRCVGSTCDYIDFKTGQIVRNFMEVTLTGNEYWASYSMEAEGQSFYSEFPNTVLAFNRSLSTHFVNITGAWGDTYINRTGIYSDHNGVINKYFRAPNSSVTTVAGFKSWLSSQNSSGTPVKLVYQYSSDDNTKKIDLPTISTTKGNCVISVISGNDSVAPIDVEYYKSA